MKKYKTKILEQEIIFEMKNDNGRNYATLNNDSKFSLDYLCDFVISLEREQRYSFLNELKQEYPNLYEIYKNKSISYLFSQPTQKIINFFQEKNINNLYPDFFPNLEFYLNIFKTTDISDIICKEPYDFNSAYLKKDCYFFSVINVDNTLNLIKLNKNSNFQKELIKQPKEIVEKYLLLIYDLTDLIKNKKIEQEKINEIILNNKDIIDYNFKNSLQSKKENISFNDLNKMFIGKEKEKIILEKINLQNELNKNLENKKAIIKRKKSTQKI